MKLKQLHILFFLVITIGFLNSLKSQTTVLSENFEGAWTVIGSAGGANTTIPGTTPASQTWYGGTLCGTSSEVCHKSNYSTGWSSSNNICGNTYPPPTCGANGTSYCALFDGYDPSSGCGGFINSPTIDLSSYCTATLTFYYYDYDENSIYVSFWNGSSWVIAATLNRTSTQTWNSYTVAVPASCLISTASIQFEAVSRYKTYPIGIDEVVLTGGSSCTGTPTGGTASASVTSFTTCSGGSSVLSLSGNTTGCGITYQWQSSPDNTTWTNISGATSSTYTATVGSTSYYQCVVKCSGSGLSGNSSSIKITVVAGTNDCCNSATNIAMNATAVVGSYTGTATGTNASATADGNYSSCFNANKNVWYYFTAPVSGSYFVSVTGGTMVLPEVSVLTGSCGAFTEASCAGAIGGTPYDAIYSNYTHGYSPYSTFAGDGYEASPYQYSYGGICNVAAGTVVYVMVDNYSGSLSYSCGSHCSFTAGPGSSGTFTVNVAILKNDDVAAPLLIDACGTTFNSSTIGATNCGNGIGDGVYNNLDNNTSTICNGSSGASGGNVSAGACTGTAGSGDNSTSCVTGGDVGYSVENDSWYEFCVTQASTVTLTFSPVAASCQPAGTDGLQISIFTGTYSGATLSLTKINGGFCGQDITSTTTFTYPLNANDCNFVEVDGFGGTNCDYSLVAAISPTCVLPVELMYFKSELTNQINVKLSWASSTEQNSDYYLVEKGTDMNNFVSLAEIKAKGNSNALTNYVAYDNNPNKGVNYYKLSSFDKNGERHLLGYTAVSNNAALSFFNLYPNPAKNSVTLSLKNFSTPALNYELYNAQGMLMDTQRIGLTNGDADYVMDISLLNKGFYFIKIINNDGVLTKTFLKSED